MNAPVNALVNAPVSGVLVLVTEAAVIARRGDRRIENVQEDSEHSRDAPSFLSLPIFPCPYSSEPVDPTKMSYFPTNFFLLHIFLLLIFGRYNPRSLISQ